MDDFLKHTNPAAWKNVPKCYCGREYEDYHDNRPHILPCSHNACFKCLSDSKCKKCAHQRKREHAVEMDYYLLGLCTALPVAKSKLSEKSIPPNTYEVLEENDAINHCYECGTETTAKCRNCVEFICKPCFDKTHQGRLFKFHTLIEDESNLTLVESLCRQHKQNAVSHFCNECQEELCNECQTNHCSTHQVITLKMMNERHLNDLNEVKKYAQDINNKIDQSIQTLDFMESSLQTEAQEAMTAVSEKFLRIHSYLQNVERKVLNKIREQGLQAIEPLAVNRAILHKMGQKIKLIDSEITQHQQHLPETSLKSFIQTAFNKLGSVPCTIKAEQISNMFEPFVHQPDKLKKIIEETKIIGISIQQKGALALVSASGNTVNTDQFKVVQKLASDASEDVLSSKSSLSQAIATEKVSSASNLRSFGASSESNSTLASVKSNLKLFSPSNNNKQNTKPICAQGDDVSHPDEDNTNFSDMSSKQSLLALSERAKKRRGRLEGKSDIEDQRISSVESPVDFYVQRKEFLCSETEFLTYCKCIGEISAHASASDIRLGEVYLVQRPKDDKWYRGKVIALGNLQKAHSVFFVDYGYKHRLHTSKFRVFSEDVRNRKDGAIQCSLYGIKAVSGKWTKETAEFMKNILNNHQYHVIFESGLDEKNEPLTVDVIVKQKFSSFSLRDALISAGLAINDSQNLSEMSTLLLLKEEEIKADERMLPKNKQETPDCFYIILKHIVSPNDFYGTKCEMMLSIYTLTSKLNSMYFNENHNVEPLYVPKKNAMCAANVNSQWYRARVVEPKEHATSVVFLVDTGETTLVHNSVLHILESEFFSHADGVLHFTLTDVKPLGHHNEFSSTCIDEFKKVCNNAKLFATVIDKDENVNIICLVAKYEDSKEININAHLVLKGFASEVAYNKDNDGDNDDIDHDNSSNASKNSIQMNSNYSLMQASPSTGTAIARIEVKIVHCLSPGEFYVNKVSELDAIDTLQNDLQDQMDQCVGIKENWIEKDDCYVRAICTKTMKLWYRGKITKIEDGEFHVFLRDFGDTVRVTSSKDLAQTIPEMELLPNAAIQCHLANVAPNKSADWSHLVKDKFPDLIKHFDQIGISFMEAFKTNASNAVLLWGMKSATQHALKPTVFEWVCINEHLVYQGHAKFSRIENDADLSIGSFCELVESIPKNDSNVDTQEIPISDDELDTSMKQWLPPEWPGKMIFSCIPTHIDGDLNIYLHDKKKRHLLNSMQSTINEQIKSMDFPWENQIWRENEPCLARYPVDSQYYRGIVRMVNVTLKMCKVEFIDYGNTEALHYRDITKHLMYTKEPALALKFRIPHIQPIGDADEWSNDAINFCKNIILGERCTVVLQSSDFGSNEVTPCNICVNDEVDLRSLLISHGYAVDECHKTVISTEAVIDESIGPDRADKSTTQIDKSLLAIIEGIEAEINEGAGAVNTKNKNQNPDPFQLERSKQEENIHIHMLPISNSTSLEPNPEKNVFDEWIRNSAFSLYPLTLSTEAFLCKVLTVIDPLTVVIIPEDDKCKMEHELMQKNINNHWMTETTPGDNSMGMICIAYLSTENTWSRGIVVGKADTDKMYNILFVDSLKIQPINEKRIRVCPKKYYSLQYAVVRLHGLKPNRHVRNDDIVAQLAHVIMHGRIYCKVIAIDSSIPEVELYKVKSTTKTAYANLIDQYFYQKIPLA